MTANWPQLPTSVAESIFAELATQEDAPPFESKDPRQVYSPVGSRVTDATIRLLIKEVTEEAVRCGFPNESGRDARIQFDRATAFVLTRIMDISWAEAGNRSVWSFLALVPLPHITKWRFGMANPERWIASDLTRHTWSRLWWQATVFEDAREVLDALSESDLNQLLERRSIGGDPRLTRELARAVINAGTSGVPRRLLIRDAARRLRRWLAFLDVRSLDNDGVAAMCALLVEETIQQTRLEPNFLTDEDD